MVFQKGSDLGFLKKKKKKRKGEVHVQRIQEPTLKKKKIPRTKTEAI